MKSSTARYGLCYSTLRHVQEGEQACQAGWIYITMVAEWKTNENQGEDNISAERMYAHIFQLLSCC